MRGWLLVSRKELPTRQIANFILESESELPVHILTGFCSLLLHQRITSRTLGVELHHNCHDGPVHG